MCLITLLIFAYFLDFTVLDLGLVLCFDARPQIFCFRCCSFVILQILSINESAAIISGSSGGLFDHTSTVYLRQCVNRFSRLG